MVSKSKTSRKEAFVARAARAGSPPVSMMAVPHTTDVPTAIAASRPVHSDVAQRTAQHLVGAVAPTASGRARVERLAASLDALIAADSAECASSTNDRRARG